MFKVKNKYTRIGSSPYCLLLTYVTPFFIISIAYFEQVNVFQIYFKSCCNLKRYPAEKNNAEKNYHTLKRQFFSFLTDTNNSSYYEGRVVSITLKIGKS